MSFRPKKFSVAVLGCLWLAGTCLLPSRAEAGPADAALRAAKLIPVLHNGRVKPLDSFARQTVKLITGGERWDKKGAVELVLGAAGNPEKAFDLRWIRIDYGELKTSLGLVSDKHFFSYNDLAEKRRPIEDLVRSAQKKRDADVRPTRLEQKGELLFSQLATLEALASGDLVTVIPSPAGDGWLSPYHVQPPMMPDFKAMLGLFNSGKFEAFEEAAQKWTALVLGVGRDISSSKLSLEVWYFNVRPAATLGVAVACHTAGILLRVLVLSRPPVSNMYESMIFMNWALILFASAFSLLRKNTPALVVGALVSGFVMLYGNLLPIDSSLEVLVPVLRSNYWLTIHVMTIVASYGAFGLAMGLGHRHLFCETFGKFSKKAAKESADLIYRVIQLGTILVGVGTVLGGVWANESWGRFWGWDPKETWALITFLVYLIVVHLRYAKKLSDFHLALSAVLGFLSVLMTWYGVNFVLGRGLHSYGSGAGGTNWIAYYLIFEAAFLGFILQRSLRGTK
ncbi:MAG: cytochrome c biogenesis protein CcsA [Candidatus Omnitrophica bacterium]|nr:cytochrome c biogenesis protein CcsA [Candidatus Omnitrophota bacterium]